LSNRRNIWACLKKSSQKTSSQSW